MCESELREKLRGKIPFVITSEDTDCPSGDVEIRYLLGDGGSLTIPAELVAALTGALQSLHRRWS